MPENESLERAFGSLRARSPDRADHFLELEEQLMEKHRQLKKKKSSRLVIAAAIALLMVVVGGVAEATTGAVSHMIKKVYYAKVVTTEPDGEQHEVILQVVEEAQP